MRAAGKMMVYGHRLFDRDRGGLVCGGRKRIGWKFRQGSRGIRRNTGVLNIVMS
jgi:hypothetical protein